MAKEPGKESDCGMILEALRKHGTLHIQELFDLCFPGCRNVAIRSRVSELVQMGFDIANLKERKDAGKIPDHIIARYGKKSKEAVYMLRERYPGRAVVELGGAQDQLSAAEPVDGEPAPEPVIVADQAELF